MKLPTTSGNPGTGTSSVSGAPPQTFCGTGFLKFTIVGWRRLVLPTLLLIVLIYGQGWAADQKKVLFISSYLPGFPTFFQEVEGIQDSFSGKNILLDIEFMGTKRFPEKSNWQRLADGLAYNLAGGNPYEAILIADDNALVFALEQQALLFRDNPIVFSGINNVARAIRQDDNPQVTAGEEPTGSERILLVDDEETVVRIEKKILERLGGYQVTAFTSSTKALEVFRAHPQRFDLLFTDMAMPDLTGERLASEILAIRPGLPIVLCTGFSERIDREKAEFMGIRGFVKKPASKSAVATTGRQALDGHP